MNRHNIESEWAGRNTITTALSKGEALGLKTGEAIRVKEREQIVINCRKAGIPVETIAAITGLTEAEIRKITGNRASETTD